jgi:hypothetical protein
MARMEGQSRFRRNPENDAELPGAVGWLQRMHSANVRGYTHVPVTF